MVKIRPFRGCYYNGVDDLADVVVSPDNFNANDSQHPYGYYRLDFSQEHQRVRERLNRWFQEGQLVQDDQPAFYVDVQHFFYHGQRHTRQDLFLSLDILNTDILSHEHTLAPMVEERYQLLATTETHLSPLFLMYSDPNDLLQKRLQKAMVNATPLFELTHQGISHTIFRLSDPVLHQAVQIHLEDQHFYIADGHHRYAAALAYASSESLSSEGRYVLAYITPMEASGLMVLPYHRYISTGFDFPHWPSYLTALSVDFDVELLPDAHQSTLETVLTQPQRCWVMQKQDQAWCIRERKVKEASDLALDILHQDILERLAGFSMRATCSGKCLHFSTDMAAVQYDLLTRGGVAFFVQPTPLTQLCARAEAHKMMPPKSTYFYPKVPSGILFNRFSTAV